MNPALNDLQARDADCRRANRRLPEGDFRAIAAQSKICVNRRVLIAGLVAGAVSGAMCRSGSASSLDERNSRPDPARGHSRLDDHVNDIEPRLHLRNFQTGEEIDLRFFRSEGYDTDAVRQADWFMRDRRENRSVEMDLRLFWALAALAQAAAREGASRPTGFLSGYRTAKTNGSLKGAAGNSFHMKARAVDFFIPEVPVRLVADYAEWLQVGGIGHYRDRFIHIDTGRTRRWEAP